MSAAHLKLGFIRLTDAAPLIVALEKGFYAEEGLDIELLRQNSWAQIRDKVANGILDGAHMLAPIVLSSWLENSISATPFVTALALNLGGNSITVSNALYDAMVDRDPLAMTDPVITARALKSVMSDRLKRGDGSPTFGAVFPYSVHAYVLRYWLAAEAIDPDRDVRIVTAHPEVMVEQLETGLIDAFCVGEPWNSLAESRGSGRAITRSGDIWTNLPDKVLGVRAQWAEENPDLHLRLVRATLKACAWLDNKQNRLEAAHFLANPNYLSVNSGVLSVALASKSVLQDRSSILELPEGLVFHHNMANFPWHSHAMWFLCQMIRWGQVTQPLSLNDIVPRAYQTDIYRSAANSLGIGYPLINSKTEGDRFRSWILETSQGAEAMSPNVFLDRRVFNPNDAKGYLEGFLRHNIRVDLDTL